MMVSVAAGTLDMSIKSQGPFSSYVPEAALIEPLIAQAEDRVQAMLEAGPTTARRCWWCRWPG